MPSLSENLNRLRQGWQTLRTHLLPEDVEIPPGLVTMSFLGAVCGVLSGGVILALHFLIDLLQSRSFGIAQWEGYAQLGAERRVLLPILGGLALGLMYQWMDKSSREGGLVHVMNRLAHHQGYLNIKNAFSQFIGASIAIASGQSVGREGAAAHLGAHASSLLGQRLALPNNSVRTLVGCGVAAGIAASFNTPLAGVIFAMEVVMLEYTIIGFAPVILAAVCATSVTHLWGSGHPELLAVAIDLKSVAELPYVLACGIIIGLASIVFLRLSMRLTAFFDTIGIWSRMACAGLVTGLCAYQYPQIIDIGFDTLNATLSGEFGIALCLGIAAAKLICTAFATGASLPGGVILPSMLTGAAIGGALGVIGNSVAPAYASSPSLYALMGMGAMMGAVLQAPLTALIVILELSGSTQMVFPAMLAVISAILVCQKETDTDSIFAMLLKQRGLNYRNDPVSQYLRRKSVIGSMTRHIARVESTVSLEQARLLLEDRPPWLLIRPEKGRALLMPSADLARRVLEIDEETESNEAEEIQQDQEINLLELPGQRLEAVAIHLRATLQEAYDLMEKTGAQAVLVERHRVGVGPTVFGALTVKDIERAYHH